MSYPFGCGPMTVREIASIIGVAPVYYGCDGDALVKGVEKDSREVTPGDLYVAIRGERFDGADFSASAVLNGAVCVLADRPPEKPEELGRPFAFLGVPNAERALGDLASAVRRRRNIKIVAVTGSVGKTTTKEMIASVLSQKYKVGKTTGNLNTAIGLSLTLLGFDQTVEVGVVEMGMSNFGEIERLSEIGSPDVGVITNIGTSHIEFLGSREGIAKAKCEILAGMGADALLVANGDEPLLAHVTEKHKNTTFFTVDTENGTYHAENIRYASSQTTFDLRANGALWKDVKLPTLGKHHVYAALIATAIGESFGVSESEIRHGLCDFTNAAMRQNIREINGITVIDASYNASPESMRASLSVLSELAREKNARKFALLGDMRELGAETRPQHERLGRDVAAMGLDGLITFGVCSVMIAESAKAAGMDPSRVDSAIDLNNPEACAEMLLSRLHRGDVLLVKASRAVAAEKIIEKIIEHGEID